MSRVEVDGVGIEYQVAGEGRPVVLLHGFPDSGRVWRHQVPALAAVGFQVIVPDLRGYGRSGQPGAVRAYSVPCWPGTSRPSWAISRSAGRMWSVTTGGQPWLGRLPPSRRTAWTT